MKAVVLARYLLALNFSFNRYVVPKSITNAEKPTTANLNIFSKKTGSSVTFLLIEKRANMVYLSESWEFLTAANISVPQPPIKNKPPTGVTGPAISLGKPVRSAVAKRYSEPEKHNIPIKNNTAAVSR